MGHGGKSLDVNVKDQDGLQILGFYQNLKAAEVSRLIYPKAKIRPGSTEVYRLPNIPCLAVHLKAKSTNTGDIWVGGVDSLEAAVNYGMPLDAGESMTLKPENSNLITLLGENSTDEVYCLIEIVNAQEPTFIDSLPVDPDTTPPTLDTKFPADGATSVARNTQVYGIFSEAIDPASVSASSFTITGGTVPTTNRFVDPTNSSKVIMEFSSDLDGLTTYTITFKGTGGSKIADLAGNFLAADQSWSFTTSATGSGSDTTPPTVSSTNPTSGATEVATSTEPTVTFSENMLSSTITTANIKINRVSDGVTVSTGVSLGVDNKTVTITGTLTHSTEYQIVVTTGVKDLAGNNMAAQFTSNFTTAAPSYTQIYTCADDGNVSSLSQDDAHDEQIGLVVKSGSSLIGKKPARLTVKLKREGSPTGPIRIRIRDGMGNDGNILHTFTETRDASTIATTSGGTNYTFSDPTNTVALAVGYQIAIEYTDPSSNATNRIRVYKNQTNVINNVNLVTMGTNNVNPDDETGQEFAGTLYEVTA